MLEVSVEDRWVALSDDGAIKESLPITTNHADNQLQHLEKVYGYPHTLPLLPVDMELDTDSTCHQHLEKQSYNSQPLESCVRSPSSLLGHSSVPAWNACVSGSAPLTTLASVDNSLPIQESSHLTPYTSYVGLISPNGLFPYAIHEDSSVRHGSSCPSSSATPPLTASASDQTLAQMIVAQSYAALAHNSTHLSNLQLLHQLPSPPALSTLPDFPTTILSPQPGAISIPMSLFNPAISYSLSLSLPSPSAPLKSMDMNHLTPFSPSAPEVAAASNPSSPSLSISTSYTPSTSPSILPSKTLTHSFTSSSVQPPSHPSHPYLFCSSRNINSGHISPNGNLSPSSPRVSTLARKRGVHQSTGPKLTSDASDGPTSCSSLEPGATTQNSNKCYRSNTRSGSMFMCPVCLKNYANNSTLRRHLKIHAYACSAAVAAAATAAATTSATSTTTTPPTRGVSPSPLSTDYTFAGLASGKQPQTRLLSPVGVDTDTREVSIIDASGNGYPSDITLMSTSSLEPITSAASPLLTVYEPTLTSHRSMISTTSSSPTSSPTYSSLSSSSTISNPSSSSSLTPSYSSSSSSSSSSFLSMPALATTSALLSSSILQYRPGIDTDYRKPECVGCNKAFARRDTVILHIKNIRRKWEIHWREQKMKSGGDSSGSSYGHYFEPEMYDVLRTKVKEKEDEKEEEDDVELDDKKKKARSRNCARTQSGNDADVADFINDSSEYLSEEATITDHSITSDYKRQRVMKKEPGSPLPASPKQPQSMFTKEEEKELLRELARASACYRERKVRMFGSFGMVEEPVLQD